MYKRSDSDSAILLMQMQTYNLYIPSHSALAAGALHVQSQKHIAHSLTSCVLYDIHIS